MSMFVDGKEVFEYRVHVRCVYSGDVVVETSGAEPTEDEIREAADEQPDFLELVDYEHGTPRKSDG